MAAVANQPEDNRLAPETIPEPWGDLVGSNSYVPAPIERLGQNAIELYGSAWRPISRRMKSVIRASGRIQRSSFFSALYIRNHYKSSCPSNNCLLEPMDLVTITDTLLGLTNVAFASRD